MNKLNQWITIIVTILFLGLSLIGCSKNSDEDVPKKMSSEIAMDHWLKKHFSRNSDTQDILFKSFYSCIFGEDSPTNIGEDFPDDDEKSEKFFNELVAEAKLRRIPDNKDMKTIIYKIETAFSEHYLLSLNEQGKARLKNDKETFILEFTELLLNILMESIKEGIYLWGSRE